MSWTRRGFLGSVLGTVAATAFYAMLPSDPFQRTILPYRMSFYGQGFEFQAPGVANIERIDNGFRFIAEPLDLTEAGIVKGVALYTGDGKFVTAGDFASDIYFVNGDQLKVQYNLQVHDRKTDTPDQLIKCFLERPDLIANRKISYENCRFGKPIA